MGYSYWFTQDREDYSRKISGGNNSSGCVEGGNVIIGPIVDYDGFLGGLYSNANATHEVKQFIDMTTMGFEGNISGFVESFLTVNSPLTFDKCKYFVTKYCEELYNDYCSLNKTIEQWRYGLLDDCAGILGVRIRLACCKGADHTINGIANYAKNIVENGVIEKALEIFGPYLASNPIIAGAFIGVGLLSMAYKMYTNGNPIAVAVIDALKEGINGTTAFVTDKVVSIINTAKNWLVSVKDIIRSKAAKLYDTILEIFDKALGNGGGSDSNYGNTKPSSQQQQQESSEPAPFIGPVTLLGFIVVAIAAIVFGLGG